jgi:hypothetical protein
MYFDQKKTVTNARKKLRHTVLCMHHTVPLSYSVTGVNGIHIILPLTLTLYTTVTLCIV